MDRRKELAVAVAHAERGEELVERQREMVARLSAGGLDVLLARQLLEKLETTLVTLRDHCNLIRCELEDEMRPHEVRRAEHPAAAAAPAAPVRPLRPDASTP